MLLGDWVAMARPMRIEYEGAVYHVMARGNQGRAIFDDDADRKAWLETLAEGCEKTGWWVHAYVLMGNHLSVQVTATDDPQCKTQIGWWTITITWRAWPSP